MTFALRVRTSGRMMAWRMQGSAFLDFIRLVIAGDSSAAARQLRANPELATLAWPIGGTTGQPTGLFFPEIQHHLYGGDTALHLAAAAYSRPMAELLVSHGADCRARNRRGAEPLHYASDGNRSARDQAAVITYLISIGADPNAVDKSGVAPLHRAVRKRSVAAVLALLDGGAKLHQPNKSGSTPLHLAVQNTGASGSGSERARQQQKAIIELLLARGAKATDRGSGGKTVKDSATSTWVRELLTGSNRG